MGNDWDVREPASIYTVDGVLGTGEEALRWTVAAPAIRSTRGSAERVNYSAAAHGMFPLPESSMVSIGG